MGKSRASSRVDVARDRCHKSFFLTRFGDGEGEVCADKVDCRRVHRICGPIALQSPFCKVQRRDSPKEQVVGIVLAERMQETIVNIVILGLFAFLFATISSVRKNARLRCWVGGWLCVLAHFAIEVWEPTGRIGQHVQACMSVDALAMAGIFFVISTAILYERGGVRALMAALLAVWTIACIDLAILNFLSADLLAAIVAGRQLVSLFMGSVTRRERPVLGSTVIGVCLLSGSWMLYGIFHGQRDVVIDALLAEIFLLAAVDFYTHAERRSIALLTTTGGLAAWALVFPVAYAVQTVWPRLLVDQEIWNTPKFCVVAGMILVVLEEDTRAAQALSDDYRLLFDNNPNRLWITDIASEHLVAANQVALDMHGYTEKEFLKLRLSDILHPEAYAVAHTQIHLPHPQPNRASRHLRKDGSSFPLDLTVHNLDFHGKPCRFIMGVDVAEREALEEQLHRQIGHDSLTGLPNRVLFPELLERAVEHAVEAGETLAVLELDIDRFKRVNDAFGLDVGDECIRRIAAMLTSHVRAIDIVARTAGDEFAIVLTGLSSTAPVQQRLHEFEAMFSEPLVVQGYKVQLSFSIGLAIGPGDGMDHMALWRGAESARRRAKACGGAQAVWLSAELQNAAEARSTLEAHMRLHLDDGGFYLVYQPIYGPDGRVRALEALLRLEHHKLGNVSPGTIIPIAEESGLIVPLGQWVMEQVCSQIRAWKSACAPTVPVALNVSGLELMNVDFASRLTETIEHYAVDPRWIHLEVTESAAMRDLGEIAEQMAMLSAQGISFSIDDFGTGYSSLARLHQLRISELKIDRSFIGPLRSHNDAYSIVQAILTLSRALGHETVAEGVETAGQLACLLDLGCDFFQGFLLSRPALPDQIPALIAATHPAFRRVNGGSNGSVLIQAQPTASLIQ